MRQQLALVMLGLAVAYPLQDLMTQFPGYPNDSPPSFAQFSGYLTIPNSNGKSLHYVFVESQNNPEADPLVLWLNGGPGCSSLDGFFYEHGPYLFAENGSLQQNPYAWNTNASMIYLESPAGVGFSLFGNIVNNSTDDEITADDNLEALLQWFMVFPEYANHDFYITGESYGGIYVPTLAYAILQYNEEVGYTAINLKGIAVGNGVTDWTYDTVPALVETLWSHNMIVPDLYNAYNAACANPSQKHLCDNYSDYIGNVLLNNTNIYNLYDSCINTVGYTGREYTPWLPQLVSSGKLGENVPCVDSGAANIYLNENNTRKAFHINANAATWAICQNLNYTIGPDASIWAYPTLIANGLRIFIYSGDVDGSVPTLGTRSWIAELRLTMLQDHESWYVDGQVAGYTEVYDGLTFVTVKGAGHMVPQYKPRAAQQMFQAFIWGTSLT